MPNKKTEFPYCRRCNKTRNDSSKWPKLTANGQLRKAPCCGVCGQMLAWGPKGSKYKSRINNYTLNNVATNLDIKTDIKNHIDDWKKFVQTRGAKGGKGSPIHDRILKERKKWDQLKK